VREQEIENGWAPKIKRIIQCESPYSRQHTYRYLPGVNPAEGGASSDFGLVDNTKKPLPSSDFGVGPGMNKKGGLLSSVNALIKI